MNAVALFFKRSELTRTVWLFRREFAIVGIFSAVTNLLMLAPTLYMLQVYDRVMLSRSETTLIAVSLFTLLLYLVMAFSEWSRSRLLVRLGVRLDTLLSTRVFNANFEANLQQSEGNPSRVFADLTELRQFLTGNGIFAFFDAPWTPIYLTVLFMLHPFLGIVAIFFALIQAGLAKLGHSLTVTPAKLAQESQAQALQFLQAKLRNTEAVEPMGMQSFLYARWYERHLKALLQMGDSQAIGHKITALSKWVRYVQQSLALGAGALLVIDGQLSPGGMIAANVLMTRALSPIDQMVGVWRQFLGMRGAFERLENLLQQYPERDPALLQSAPQGRVNLHNVSATAVGRETPILRDINLAFTPGEVTVVMGPSGSGKSTLARVLLGIWPHTQGQVLLDERPIAHWKRKDLGSHIGYLPQDIELFDGSIAENIARFGELDSPKVIEATQAAGLHDMILRLPQGYDTSMGEAGQLLSGGQRQRVALARTMYGKPALIVLDEPNANLDDVGEQALSRAVMGMKQQGQTVVLISHRPSAIQLADHLVILSDGLVVHAGPRDQILSLIQK
jgi:ATP-binding cassette subfamily C exporter for protease/lipase